MGLLKLNEINLKTNRGSIRSFKEADLPTLTAYHNNSKWMQYQGFKNLTQPVYAAAVLPPTSAADGKQLAFVNQDDELLGDFYVEQTPTEVWIGYTINPAFARQGFATEGLQALLKYIQGQKVSVVKADIFPGNLPSRKLIEKLGFELVGQTDEAVIYQLRLTN